MQNLLAPGALDQPQSYIRAVTRLIDAVGGVNLGQGTCALPPSPEVLQAAMAAINAGHNSYTFYDGIPSLKTAIADRVLEYNNIPVTEENVLVTSGATGAFECICKCFLEPGDEVIVFEPIYQYHQRQARERGATIRIVRLHAPDWSIDPQELENAFSGQTKLLVFSNPNNPSGKVFNREELFLIGDACTRHNVIAVVDQVYEYIVSDGAHHVSLAALPGMFERTLTLSSASKTLFVTGWRVGWVTGPQEIMLPLGIKSDQTYVCAPAPFQHAIAHALQLPGEFFDRIRLQFEARKSRLVESLKAAGFIPHAPQGAYYILAGYPREFGTDDVAAMKRLVEEVGVGAVPGREFFPSETNTGMLRFCYAVTDDDLEEACQRLDRLHTV